MEVFMIKLNNMAKANILEFVTNGAEAGGATEAKQVDFEDFATNLEFDQWRGLDYTYDIEPQSQNLFWAGYFCEAGDGKLTSSTKMFYNAAYRIKKVSIPFPSMEIEYHPETRSPLVKTVSYANEVQIDWFEDVYHSVQKYHVDWFNRWYSREYDCFRCGIKGKFRKMAVVAFHYVNDNKESIIPVPKIEPLFAFIIGGMTPKTIPSMNFDYNSDSNDSLLAMTYTCGPIRWVYGNSIGRGDESNVDKLFNNNAEEALNALDRYGVKAPLQTALDVPEAESPVLTLEKNWETLRIVRAATYYQAAEASL
jgi:hypothetical protein